jgi:hypothetical protein
MSVATIIIIVRKIAVTQNKDETKGCPFFHSLRNLISIGI